jgi:hypothetical protein
MPDRNRNSDQHGRGSRPQDDLMADYLDSMFLPAGDDSVCVVEEKYHVMASSIRSGFELQRVIDLKMILAGDCQPTSSQALMILLLNIRLLRTVPRPSRLAEFIVQVSEDMVQRLSVMTIQQDLLIKAVKSGTRQRQ